MARHDIILFGATGFTGGLVADYLAQTLEPGQLSWALAGRDLRKLRRVRERLAERNTGWAALPLYQAVSDEPESLHDLAARTRVMVTTVGPYTRRGEALVAACVAQGCDYLDLTGEPLFWRGLIDRHHDEAASKGLRLVPCCGFDSIPHDLGVLFTVGQLKGDGPIHIDGYVAASGGMSGGTWNSLVQALGEARATMAATRGDPGRTDGPRPRSRRQPRPHYAPDVGRWVLPMPTIDPLVIRRSARLTGAYGEDFRYHHYMQTKSLAQLGQLAAGLGTLYALAQTPVRPLMKRLRPAGTGPDEEQRARGWFKVQMVGRQGDAQVTTQIRGGDPGYGHTAKMIAEAARCLVEDREHLPERYGLLTPAAAMGTKLVERMQRTGMEFSVA